MPSKTIVAILCITALDALAMLKGFDGKYLLAGVFAIAGLGGYPIIQRFLKLK